MECQWTKPFQYTSISITAGMLAKNTDSDVVDFSTIVEYRGESFTMGGVK